VNKKTQKMKNARIAIPYFTNLANMVACDGVDEEDGCSGL
jgi:hypothetical protein